MPGHQGAAVVPDSGVATHEIERPGLIQIDDNNEHWLELMAMRINFLRSCGLGATTKRNERNCSFTRTRKIKKRKPF